MKKYVFLFFIILFPINVFASARSTVVMDVDSGRVLYQNNANEKRLVASITKIMTSVVVLENANVNKKVTVGDEVLKMYGTNIYVSVGEELTIKDLLYGLILRSGNDASVVLSKNVLSGKFVDTMNKKANELNMYGTVFSNPHGLDEETKNYSTAMDMAKLSRYAYNNLELYRDIIKTKKYTLETNKKSYVWYNRNKLLTTYKYCIGGKTGYTPSSGKTLVSYAKRGNLTLEIVTLKDSNHYENHKNLYEYYFNKYKSYKIVDKSTFRVDQEFYKDKLYIKEDYYYPLAENEINDIKTIVKITKLKSYNNNDKVGEIEIKFKDEKVKVIDIFVEKKKKKRSFFSLFTR